MAIFKKKTHQHLYERALTVIAIVATLGSMIPAQVVNAKTQQVVVSVVPLEPLESGLKSKDKDEQTSFPKSAPAEAAWSMTVVATAYSSDPYQTDNTPCIPAMGSFDLCENYEKFGIENTIAANFLPLGTQVKFPELFGDAVFVVRDRMNAKYNGTNRIDFWIGSVDPKIENGGIDQTIVQEAKTKAVAFGVQVMTMEVFGK